nr:ABC-three component system protein [uncultured Deefgea sp.]
MAFDASPSWSGFNYQGKVALYYTLVLINAQPNTDWSNYSLMLESTEDFEILFNGVSVSFHQVKAYNSSSYSKYSEALLEISLELYKHQGVVGRIHTWKQINPKEPFLSLTASVRNDIEEILTEYQNSNPKIGSTTLEKAASSASGIPKPSAILRAAFPGKTSAELFTILQSIISNPQDNTLDRLEAYKYGLDSFCDLSNINENIKIEINQALKIRKPFATNEQLEKSLYYFLGMIDLYIIQRHKTQPQGQATPITFNEIIQALETDHEDVSKEYLAFKFKENFAYLIDQYMSDEEDYTDPAQGIRCNLKAASKLLLGMSAMELWAHYRDFSPQIHLQHINNTDNAIHIDLLGIRYALIKTLHTINIERASHRPTNKQFIYRTASLPHQYFLPTTITNLARVSQIVKDIKTNPNMSEILFEVENLIYTGNESHSFTPDLMAHTAAPIAAEADARPKRNEILQTINLVPLTTAKDALV